MNSHDALGSGSDASSLTTTAQLDESTGEYVINGGKAFISGAGHCEAVRFLLCFDALVAGMSDIYLVMCREGDGISCWLVPLHAKGSRQEFLSDRLN